MSMEKVHLRKLLQIFYMPDSKALSKIRQDVLADSKTENGAQSDGGDFHAPFWSDAKRHALGELDLREETKLRIASNHRRRRLYPQLMEGFLEWWNERRRWRNEPFAALPHNVKARLAVPGTPGIVKVENLLGILVGDRSNRLVYPYFSEVPTLVDEAARLGLWAMEAAFPEYQISDMRVLDVLRGRSFSTDDTPLRGNEEQLFRQKYGRVLEQWHKLKEEIG